MSSAWWSIVVHNYRPKLCLLFLSAQEFGFVHLSAGDLLRQARDSGSSDGQLISEYIKEGKIVPVEITIRLLQNVSWGVGGQITFEPGCVYSD